jgi:hypothetical protein
LIDSQLAAPPPVQMVLILCIDRGLAFADARYAPLSVASSCATSVELAAVRRQLDGPR